MGFKIIARHKWVAKATISESCSTDDSRIRRYTATICGWRNWRIFEGDVRLIAVEQIIDKVRSIRDRIEANDESIFVENVTL